MNWYVELQLLPLNAQGETLKDIIVNLFEAYKHSSDKTFCKYIKKKEDDWMEVNDVEPGILMALVKAKYQLLFQTKKWNAPTPEDKKLLALVAKLKWLK